VLVGLVLMIVFIIPLSIGLAIGTGFGYALLPPPTSLYLLRAVLLGLYLLWLLFPIIGFALNESYDITKLFLFPISPRMIFLGALFGSMLDLPTLLTLPFLGAMLYCFSSGFTSIFFITVTLLIFLCHTLALSQTILLLSTSLLRSRRWRDVMMILGPLIALLWFFMTQIAPRYAAQMDWRVILNNRFFRCSDYLPSGFAYQAIGAAQRGAWLPACGVLLLLVAVTVATVWLAGYLVELVTTGDALSATGHRASPANDVEHSANNTARPPLTDRFLPPVMVAMAEKELKYLSRDPLFKMTLMNSLYMCVVFGFVFLRPFTHNDAGFHLGSGVLWTVSVALLFSGSVMLFNIFGSEGHAASYLLQLPSSRRQIILGKNLVFFSAFRLENLLLLGVFALLVHQLDLLPRLYVFAIFATLIFTAVGNMLSIWNPHRLVMRGWHMQPSSASQGCTYSLIYFTAVCCCGLLLLPPAAALIVPLYWVSGSWLLLTLPLAVMYTAGLYLYSLYLAERQLLRQEIEVVGKLSAEE